MHRSCPRLIRRAALGLALQAYLALEWAVIWPPTFTLWPRRNNYEQTSRRVRVMSALPPISHLSSPFNENVPRRRALNPSAAPKEDVMFKALPVAVFVTVMSLSFSRVEEALASDGPGFFYERAKDLRSLLLFALPDGRKVLL